MAEWKKWIEPTKPERERLYILIEELNEVSQVFNLARHIALKVLRFGFDEVYPKTKTDNRARLEAELGDVLAVIDRMLTSGDINQLNLEHARVAKHKKLQRYTRDQNG